MRNVPKLKGRNPMQVLKQLPSNIESFTLNQEVISLLSQFNIQQCNIAEFYCDTLKMNDMKQFSNNEIIESILAQSKVRDLFARLNKGQTSQIVQGLIKSINDNNAYENKGQCIRMLGHLLYEDNEFENQTLEQIYKGISKLAFDNQSVVGQVPLATSGSVSESTPSGIQTLGGQQQQSASKLQRLALNCIANLFLKPSPIFMKSNAESLYNKLKSSFEGLMRKIQLNYKSKRFVSTLTTVIRALQLSLNEMLTNQKLVINDNECIKLFLNFYKLLFLGSPFAEKMLHIKFEESKTTSKNKGPTKLIHFEDEEEELKSDTSFIIDTSDMSSQSDGGSIYGSKNSPSESGDNGDHYQKVKTSAVLCLQYLFKSNSKTLFNYWYLLFPSFFMKPQSEFTPYLTTFPEKKEEFFFKVQQIVKREPSMFYLLRAYENNTRLKNTICFTLSIMLENQIIQKWQGQLEKEVQTLSQSQQQQMFLSMANILGQFLRFLHYQILYMIQSEVELSTNSDQQLLCQLVKTVGTLIHITPYSKMNKGLVSIMLESLLKLLLSQESKLELDSPTKLAILNVIQIALNIPDIIEELDQNFFCENQITTLLQFLTTKKQSDNLGTSPEAIQIIQRLAKNYPHRLLELYDKVNLNEYLGRQMFFGLPDKKKIISLLKILEEWVKNYKSKSLIAGDADDDERIEGEEESKVVESIGNPYNLESFKHLMNQLVDHYFYNKANQIAEICIAILNVLNNLDSIQWRATFSPNTTSTKILGFIYSGSKASPFLKAASIKMLGYMVYYDLSSVLQAQPEEKLFMNKVYSMVFEFAGDSNLNVQIRNSWTLANLSFINKASLLDDYLAQETLIISLNYALCNKEKVASNGLRSLGYILQQADLKVFQEKTISQINKSQQQLQRIQSSIGPKSKILSLDRLILIILENLDNKSPKIAWNSCVALANILENPSLDGSEILFSGQSVRPLLKALEHSLNFKTKIHALSTLMKFKESHTFKEQNLFADIWLTLLNSLGQHNEAVYSTQDQKKYVQALDSLLFALWQQLALQASRVEYYGQIKQFINQNSLLFLQTTMDYLRKELKVPKYSEMYDDLDLLTIETQNLFLQDPRLEHKLQSLQSVITIVRNIIKENEDVHVSFGVFESLNSLAETDVKQYRLVDTLKVQKASFQPSFDDHSSSSASEV